MAFNLFNKIDQLIDDATSNEEKERKKQLSTATKTVTALKNSLLSVHNLKLLMLYKFTTCSSMLTTLKQNDLLVFGYCRKHYMNISNDIVDYIVKYQHKFNIKMIITGGKINTQSHLNGNIVITPESTILLGFPSMRSDIPIPIYPQQKKYYYEFIVGVRSIVLAQIGFCDDYCCPDGYRNGVGDDKHSWAFDGGRVAAWYNCNSVDYGKKWNILDIVGCCIDIHADTNTCDIGFYLNGQYLGIAFKNQNYSGNVYPACSFQCSSDRIEDKYVDEFGMLVFAEHLLKFMPTECQPVI